MSGGRQENAFEAFWELARRWKQRREMRLRFSCDASVFDEFRTTRERASQALDQSIAGIAAIQRTFEHLHCLALIFMGQLRGEGFQAAQLRAQSQQRAARGRTPRGGKPRPAAWRGGCRQ